IMRRGEFDGGDAQPPSGQRDAVELAREIDKRAIAAPANGVDDRDDVAIDGATVVASAAGERVEKATAVVGGGIEEAQRHGANRIREGSKLGRRRGVRLLREP